MLHRSYAIHGVGRTQATVVLEGFFGRPAPLETTAEA